MFKLVREISLYDFVKYFKTFKEKFSKQNTETKPNLDDYLEKIEDVSQEIIVKMVFDIETDKNEINNKKQELLALMKVSNIDEKIFDIIKKDLKL